MSECGIASSGASPIQGLSSDQKQSWVKFAERLAYFTIGYNILEGAVSIFLGIREESFALAGFGFDSLIEVASAFLVLWRLRSDFEHGAPMSIAAERKATFGIGLLFIILSLVAALAALIQLSDGDHPVSTMPGVVISLLSLSFMFYLWRSKLQTAKALGSKTLESDAACSFACIKLSGVLLAGSLLFTLLPTLWWIDSVAALILSGLILHEGYETIKTSRREDFTGGCCH